MEIVFSCSPTVPCCYVYGLMDFGAELLVTAAWESKFIAAPIINSRVQSKKVGGLIDSYCLNIFTEGFTLHIAVQLFQL